ncbi:MAG: energy-coupling factor ABC transporter permease [Oligoflexia bacterium]|nr:energy-coupling factor ABC transporter permease [Oligoflexia bacterium]
MHIPDGFLSLPVSAATIAGSVIYGIWSHHYKKIGVFLEENKENIPLIACSASFIFAAQMLNFPIAAGTSGHFLGASFATFIFGPQIAFFILSSVLIIQSLFFADGGLLALGANIFVMGIVAPLSANFIYNFRIRYLLNVTKLPFMLMLASWFSVVASSFACSILLSLSGTVPLKTVLIPMIAVHSLIGIGEAIITLSATTFLKKSNILRGEIYAIK